MRLASAGLLVLLGGCQWLLHLDEFPEPGPDAPVVPGTWAHVAAGRFFTCAIDLTQNLYCWGYNGDDELGMAGPGQLPTPTLVPGASWSQVTAGTLHACGLQVDNTLWCWGSNYNGQLGDGTTSDANQPRKIGTSTWKSVATFEDTTCAIDTSDQLFCWGDNGNGAVGVNSLAIYFNTPQPVMAGTTWQAVAPGSDHTCALTMDQHVYCWGANWDGQVGNAPVNQDNVLSPVPVAGGGTFVAIAAGYDFSCGVGTDGRIRCWGNNAFSQLGDGSTTQYTAPHPASSTITDFTAIRTGETVACALRANGALYCWGDATPGPLAMPQTTPTAIAAPIGAWTELAVGHRHTCGIGMVHDLWCVGDNSSGAVGAGGTRGAVKATSGMTFIAAGGDTSCGIKSDGTLWCWGANDSGQLGVGTRVRSLGPIAVSSSESWNIVSLGDSHACGITPNGTRCWGVHGLGNGSPDKAKLPTPITPDPGFVSIAAGGDHTCGLTAQASNNVWCWGANDYGQLGVGDTSPRETVTALAQTFKMTSSAYHSTCALDGTKHLRCTGRDDKAQLANGVGAMQTMFTAGTDMTAYDHIVSGTQNACALDGVGNVACWGRNDYGETGGTADPVPMPTRIPGATWENVALGSEHTCGLLYSGQVQCWGRNDFGQLGTGTFANSRAPVGVMGLPNNISYITAGDAHTCALTTDGDVWCWGKNDDGQLGTDVGWVHAFFEVPAPQ